METVIQRLKEVINYITPLVPLANSHMVNFISHKLWDTHFPDEMKEEFAEGKVDDIVRLFFGKEIDSILKIKYANIEKFLQKANYMSLNCEDGIVLDIKDFNEKLSKWTCKCHDPLHYQQFMTLKKSHEVEVMSCLIATLSTLTNTTHALDIGGGKGYLSSILALEYKLKVLGLDSCNIKTSGAASRVKKLKKYWQGTRKKLEKEKTSNNNNTCIDNSAVSESEEVCETQNELFYKQQTEFVTEVTNLTSITMSTFPEDKEFELGLIGLHTCGNLATVCLKQFVKNSDNIHYLVNVGCCYHLMDEGHSASCGFPLSNFLKEQKFFLGRNARMLSLQAQSRIHTSQTVPIESLLYRAILQQMLIEKLGGDNVPKGQVGRLADKCKDFKDYVQRALCRLGLIHVKITDEEADVFYKRYEHLKQQLLIFFMLRVSLAPVLENIILLDRLLYLTEQGIEHSYLVKMFDPVLSPRCYGIIALRGENGFSSQ